MSHTQEQDWGSGWCAGLPDNLPGAHVSHVCCVTLAYASVCLPAQGFLTRALLFVGRGGWGGVCSTWNYFLTGSWRLGSSRSRPVWEAARGMSGARACSVALRRPARRLRSRGVPPLRTKSRNGIELCPRVIVALLWLKGRQQTRQQTSTLHSRLSVATPGTIMAL